MNEKNNFELVESKLAQLASPGIRPGLARLARLLREAGSPQGKFPIVHIVGTNGKGSTAAGIYSVLRASGYKAALYTSPHLVDFSERLVIDGERAAAREWLDAASELEDIVRRTDYFKDNHPTYFEFITAAAIMILARRQPDAAVFEAGMGGRLDASNILTDVALSVVVPIGMDHTDFLGDTLEKIAAEKFAVMRKGTPALFFGDERLDGQFLDAAARCGAEPHIFRGEYRITERAYSLDGTRFTLSDAAGSREYFTPLVGSFQADNAAMAVAASRLLSKRFPRVCEETIKRGIAETQWQGRMEIVRRSPLVIVDGGHNPHAMKRLSETLAGIFHEGGLSIVLAMMKDKDISGALSLLAPLGAEIYCTEVPGLERSLSAEGMRETAERAWLCVAGTYGDPLDAIRAASGKGLPVVCCGSLFLVGYVKAHLDEL
ncbi:folylpolyglutamate synthase/dihydrofolate synthase family protein [uncultured Cloacibacillus sp.]|uniref:bifunctional folylpolyglutamate synthase/dihydrofolate synthase n=1 Tax=uncultured Cloacibacillus sp. TaxID=889794 RepID=UPI0025D40858|nr:folylpolyglutamate synthase/dihydrofolate synthase family protein [uncultured Cloacibacillus sp.]